jgi:hypothetical protein
MVLSELILRFRRVARIVCLWVGTVFILVALGLGAHTNLFLHKAITGDGVIVDLVQVHDEGNNTTGFAPAFRFQAEDGRSYTLQSSTNSDPPSLRSASM